ncbi:energy-coupling factor transporter transmembrane protein EcfT [Aurantimonas sp. Leaf443]|uniref:energy-coupling factor transporter transmembrane component T family protein n=1 Tax=Aurantimonas sp. Leaf443 TaxID=1736378 RepID=UPI0006F7645B|nr:energy-coupling factor transporter transmembrane protein EcfT [Aurantimonas sp. Leaf443]KQT88304.1 hypothetical protein ASG48_02440 [Aurantimonas sp. Leaf443]
MIASLYRPGRSVLHRMHAGWKLAALPVLGTLLFLVPSLALQLLALGVVLCLFPVGGQTPRSLAGALRSFAPILLLVALAQVWFGGWHAAALFTARLAALLLAATLVTATTRTADIVEAIEAGLGPLRRFGVDPGRVGLAIALAIRFVPLLGAIAAEIREAQAARGLDRSLLALGVPLIVRALKMSDEIADAIDARS